MLRRIVCIVIVSVASAGCSQQAAKSQPAKPQVVSKSTVNEPDARKRMAVLGSPELLRGVPGEGPLTAEQIKTWLADPNSHAAIEFELPMWMTPGCGQIKDLKENPMTAAKIELGRQLFFDKRLSADNSVSCASCHEPDRGYTVDVPLAAGIGGQKGVRNPPTLLNRVMLAVGHDKQFWDGRSVSVEDALLHALFDPTEMAALPDDTVKTLNAIPGYRMQFDHVYGMVKWEAIGDAIGCFVRCLATDNSPYDYYAHWQGFRYVDPEELRSDPEWSSLYEQAEAATKAHPISESAARGEYLFFGNKAWCSACHQGVNFTDEMYHNTGIGLSKRDPDLGRYNITKNASDWGAFKTPTIRGAIYTAPYMHDGSLKTLEEIVEWYASEGYPNRNLDYRYRRIEKLTDQDKKDLVEFVKSCSGPLPKVETGRLPE